MRQTGALSSETTWKSAVRSGREMASAVRTYSLSWCQHHYERLGAEVAEFGRDIISPTAEQGSTYI